MQPDVILTQRYAAPVLALCLAMLLLWTTGCGPSDEIKQAIEARLSEGETAHPGALRQFYAARDYRPLWTDSDGLSGRGEELTRQLCTSEGQQAPAALQAALQQIEEATGPARDTALAALEIAAAEAYLRYARDVSQGRLNPHDVDGQWHLQPDTLDVLAALDAAADDGVEEAAEQLARQHEGYEALQEALARYRTLEAEGGWPPIPGEGPLQRGDSTERVAVLKQRLVLSGDLADSTGPPVFDEAVEEAVRRFQKRHGQAEDGVVGEETLAALNVPAGARVRQLAVNLERRRWLPADYGDDYIVVNIPAFHLRAYRDGDLKLEMPVVVGTRMNETPVFADTMTYVVFNPYWNVPESIAVGELLPKLKEDGDYLAKNGYEAVRDGEVVDASAVDEEALRSYAVRIRQQPGPGNALGQVKFMFPNDLSIYLHDTPADYLFDRTERSFSHGCVRVARPAELAAYVLDGTDAWSEQQVEATMASSDHQEVQLARRLPVYLIYMTAWLDDDGTVQFREDVYGQDDALWRALERAGEQGDQIACTTLTQQRGT